MSKCKNKASNRRWAELANYCEVLAVKLEKDETQGSLSEQDARPPSSTTLYRWKWNWRSLS